MPAQEPPPGALGKLIIRSAESGYKAIRVQLLRLSNIYRLGSEGQSIEIGVLWSWIRLIAAIKAS
jgi:hypothetical protein